MRVSEIRVKRIRVNQGLGVYTVYVYVYLSAQAWQCELTVIQLQIHKYFCSMGAKLFGKTQIN